MKRIIISLSILFSASAYARPVSMNKMSGDNGVHDVASGSYEQQDGLLSSKSGNVEDLFEITTSKDLYLAFASDRWDTGPAQVDQFQHIQYRRMINDQFGVEAIAQHEHDSKQNINSRTAYGLGPYHSIFKSSMLVINAGYAAVTEKLDQVDQPVQTKDRLYGYVFAAMGFGQYFRASETFQSEPVITDSKNERLYTRTVGELKISKHFAVELSVDTIYNSMPAPGINKEYVDTTFGLEANL